MKGYKVTNSDFTCNGFKYELNKEFVHKGKVEPCSSGFHFCVLPQSCFNYYDFDSKNRVFEVEAAGEIVEHGDKHCAEKIIFLREIMWDEVLRIVNTGVNNTGHSNSGDSNSGNRNSGNWNSGNWNSGDWNSGDSNSGYRNSGAFCTDQDPQLYLFNKPSKLKVREWENSKAYSIMLEYLEVTIWVPQSVMTDQEKKDHPKYETTEGYLKTISTKEAWGNMWNNLTDANKKVFTSLENFDSKLFFEITGIKVK